jgi:hypothetical protein
LELADDQGAIASGWGASAEQINYLFFCDPLPPVIGKCLGDWHDFKAVYKTFRGVPFGAERLAHQSAQMRAVSRKVAEKVRFSDILRVNNRRWSNALAPGRHREFRRYCWRANTPALSARPQDWSHLRGRAAIAGEWSQRMSELSNGDLIARLRQVRDLVIPLSEAEDDVFCFAEDIEPILIHALGKIAGIVMATLELSAAARGSVVLSSSPPATAPSSSRLAPLEDPRRHRRIRAGADRRAYP